MTDPKVEPSTFVSLVLTEWKVLKLSWLFCGFFLLNLKTEFKAEARQLYELQQPTCLAAKPTRPQRNYKYILTSNFLFQLRWDPATVTTEVADYNFKSNAFKNTQLQHLEWQIHHEIC